MVYNTNQLPANFPVKAAYIHDSVSVCVYKILRILTEIRSA